MTQIKAQPFDCMQYMYSEVQVPLIRCCLHFDRMLDEKRLRQSLKILMNNNPILQCKLSVKKRQWIKMQWEINRYLQVIDCQHDWEMNLQHALLYSLKKDEPPLKLFLIHHDGIDTLCITVSHMICDGRGFIQLLYQLADCYRNLEWNDCKTFDLREYEQSRSFKQITKDMSTFEKLHIARKKGLISSKDTLVPIPLEAGQSSDYIVKKCINQEQLQKIIAFAKAHKAGLNDMIMTAYARALYREYGWTTVNLPCPVDLRRFLKKNDNIGICNLTGNYFCSVKIELKDHFTDTLQQVSSQMQDQKKDNICLGGPILLHFLYRFLPYRILRKIFYKASPIPVTSYTNLGILDDKKLDFGSSIVEDAYIVTAKKKPPYYQLSISTFKNKCMLTSCFCGTRINFEKINRLMDVIVDELSL
jgi:NRPS condensation-like uncharacterized protein